MLKQTLQQKLLQKLSPQQIMLMKLLQVPSVAIEQRIKEEVEENPALEVLSAKEEHTNEYGEEESDANNTNEEEFDLTDYMNEGDEPAYKYYVNNQGKDDENRTIPYSAGITFRETLISQLELRMLDDRAYRLGEYIVGSIDDAGYLSRSLEAIVDDMAFTQGVETTVEELEEILKVIQDFDPSGVGARDLRESLLLQLYRKKEKTADIENAIILIDKYFSEFAKKHYERILKRSDMTEEELKKALDIVLALNPKPGSAVSSGGSMKINQYIMPDFTITIEEGNLSLSLNSKNAPDLKINRTYAEMIETYMENQENQTKKQKEALYFIKQKIDAAKWFIDAIKQRQNTLLVTMNAIMNFQKDYFLSGDETRIKPMILKDIAEIVNLDISTVSRVANSKYVQTPYGIFLIKTFFSESMQKDSGDTVSTREIKKILSDIIEAEDKSKPLTDDNLAKMLKDKGYVIARRTVAKYRDQLSIPVARLRKEL